MSSRKGETKQLKRAVKYVIEKSDIDDMVKIYSKIAELQLRNRSMICFNCPARKVCENHSGATCEQVLHNWSWNNMFDRGEEKDEQAETIIKDFTQIDTEKMIQAIKDTTDKKIFEERKESGDIKEDFALILNPKHKDIISELWYKTGIVIPIVWSTVVEEEKIYVVTDKNFVRNAIANMHSVFGLPGWLSKYEGEWVTGKKGGSE